MKKTKMLTAFVLALIMVLSLSVGLFAKDWESFRGNSENMGLTDSFVPKSSTEAEEKWVSANLGSSSFATCPGGQIIIGDYLYGASQKILYKLDKETGKTVQTAALVQSHGFNVITPVYGDGKIFVGASNGTIQAFDAKTLKSLWVYTDLLGGQSLSPITYHNGCIYTGFWKATTTEANFVCIPVEDKDTNNEQEAQESKWVLTHTGGFYWAGAYVNDDYVVVTADKGTADPQYGQPQVNNGTLYSLDKETGVVVDTEEFLGDGRSSVSYDKETDKLYFVSKGADLCSAKIGSDGKFSDFMKVSYMTSAADSDSILQSTTTPVVFNGRVYFGIGTLGGEVNYIVVAKASDLTEIYRAAIPAYSQNGFLVSTSDFAATGDVYIYTSYNNRPGGIVVMKDSANATSGTVETLYEPAAAQQNYCIVSLAADEEGTLYYSNDNGYVMAVKNKNPKFNVAVGIYDYTAMDKKVEGASENGTVMPKETVTVSSDATALDAIKAVLDKNKIPYEINAQYNYISKIGALGEFAQDYEASGWVFSINDDFGNQGANATALSKGDVLELHYSLIGYGEDVGNYWGSLPTLSKFTLANQSLKLTKETAASYVTTYYVDDGSGKKVLEGKGSKEEPFLLKLSLYPSDNIADGKAKIETGMNDHYYTLSPNVKEKQDYSKPLSFTLSTKGDRLQTHYTVTVTKDKTPVTDIKKMTDIPNNIWYEDSAQFCLDRGILVGTSKSTFGSTAPMTRAEFVTTLGRYSGVKDASEDQMATTKFKDIKGNAYYASHVAWAVEKGITYGTSETTFAPDAKISREDMAAMMVRYAKTLGIALPDADTTLFADNSKIAGYAKDAVYRLKAAGVLHGKGDNQFDPKGSSLRSEVSVVLSHFITYSENQ